MMISWTSFKTNVSSTVGQKTLNIALSSDTFLRDLSFWGNFTSTSSWSVFSRASSPVAAAAASGVSVSLERNEGNVRSHKLEEGLGFHVADRKIPTRSSPSRAHKPLTSYETLHEEILTAKIMSNK